MGNICGNCEQEIFGTMYITSDEFILCGDCFYELKDDMDRVDEV